MVVKTFRGLLADGAQDHIRLSTTQGKVGYRIVKLQVIGDEPGEGEYEHTVKIYKTEQTTVTNTVNFSDGDLLGVVFYQDNANNAYPATIDIIFDREIFNQDIYITADATQESYPINYYLELETVSLTEEGAEYTTIKDIRTQKQ